MNIDYINTLYPDAKNKNPKLYIQSLETVISVLEEKIEMLESCIFNNEKHIATYKELFDESMRLLERNRIEMYGDDENDGQLIETYRKGMHKGSEITKEVMNEQKTH